MPNHSNFQCQLQLAYCTRPKITQLCEQHMVGLGKCNWVSNVTCCKVIDYNKEKSYVSKVWDFRAIFYVCPNTRYRLGCPQESHTIHQTIGQNLN
jgi:hypothetical protein